MSTSTKVAPESAPADARARGLHILGRLALHGFLPGPSNGARTAALIDQVARDGIACPRCGLGKCARHGFANGLQRYRCRACGRTFNGLTGTPLARLRMRDKWPAYWDCLIDPACTAQHAADRVQVHANTSYRWRHRFLHCVNIERPAPPQDAAAADQPG